MTDTADTRVGRYGRQGRTYGQWWDWEGKYAAVSVSELHDETLRTAVLQTWEASMKASPFDHLDQVPQSPVMADRGLLRHVNEVNERALDVMNLAKEHYSLDFDDDITLATAILHDVDKPLIFRFDGTAFSAAPGTNLTDHGTLGADLALTHGVPRSIADLVRVHSPFASTGLPGTVEGTIVHYADFVSNDLACLQWGAETIHASNRLVRKEGK
jgi:putative nucleotidyltransferase with HDIG domain